MAAAVTVRVGRKWDACRRAIIRPSFADPRKERAAACRRRAGAGPGVRSELAEPFETLLSDKITISARERAEIIDREWREVAEDWSEAAEGDLVGAGVQSCRGLSFETLVGAEGLEPPTSSL